MNFGNERFGVDEGASRRILDAYFDRGGNFVDTADAYAGGVSEEIVGRALEGRRHRVVLATKGFYPVVANFGEPPEHVNAFGSTRKHLREALHASLRRLRTDHVDLYQVHCWDDQTPVEETLSTLDRFVSEGKVLHVGLSNWPAWRIAEARQLCIRHGWEPFVTAQMQYSLICRDIEHDVVPCCARTGVGILPWSPLGQGVLTGKYAGPAASGRLGGEPVNASQAAWRARFLNDRTRAVVDVLVGCAREIGATPTAASLAWLLARPGVSSVIMGPKSVEQLEQNLAGSGTTIPPPLMQRLDEVSAPPPRYPEWFIAASPRA
jgi:aryl-alcohol dehydrogenase-like predicted oxidoreductase